MSSQPAPKKPYASPRLVAYGNVAKLTQGGGSVIKDDGHHIDMARINQGG
jgi:hypothetical protein